MLGKKGRFSFLSIFIFSFLVFFAPPTTLWSCCRAKEKINTSRLYFKEQHTFWIFGLCLSLGNNYPYFAFKYTHTLLKISKKRMGGVNNVREKKKRGVGGKKKKKIIFRR